MVKMLAGFVLVHFVAVLELVGALLLAIAAGLAFGGRGVLCVAGVFLLLKSFELDVKAKK